MHTLDAHQLQPLMQPFTNHVQTLSHCLYKHKTYAQKIGRNGKTPIKRGIQAHRPQFSTQLSAVFVENPCNPIPNNAFRVFARNHFNFHPHLDA
jgi:hypothetical protein